MASYYSQRPPSIDPDTACSGLECAAVGAFDLLAVFAWVGVLGILVGLTYLTRARERCDEERRRTRHEVRAFDEFARRVRQVEAATPPSTASRRPADGPVVAGVSSPSPPDDDGMRAVRDAYRETVMSVPHYGVEYDEPLTENVAAEFDPDAAVALGSADRLTPQIKRALVQTASDASDRRERFLESVERERDSISAATETLRDVETALERLDERPLPDRSFRDLHETWRQIRRLRSRVEDLVADRQDELHAGETAGPGAPDVWSLNAYLYAPLDCEHPVLAEATGLLDVLSTAERRLVRSLTARA